MNGSVVKITDFGAVPNDKTCDCAAAVQQAIEELKKCGGGTIEFPNGEYNFGAQPIQEERAAIPVYDADSIAFSGCGSKIIVSTPFIGVFALRNCRNVTIRGFEIEYNVPPWTQGTVTKADSAAESFEYVPDDGYDVFALPGYGDCSAAWGIIENPKNRHMLRPDAPEHFILGRVKSIGNGKYSLTPKNSEMLSKGIIKEGDRIVYTCRTMTGSVIAAFHSENITAEDLLVHECGDCLFVGAYLGGTVKIRNYRTEFKNGNDIVSVADGVHIQGSRAAVLIENCSFKGLLDDCVNLYQMTGKVTGTGAAITLNHPEGELPRKGETVMFYDSQSQREKLRTTVQNVKKTGDGQCEIETGGDATGILTGDTFCIAECMAPFSRIINNTFMYSRRYGLLIKSRDTEISGNRFEKLGADAVNFASDVSDYHKEGAPAENILIENNKITDVCYRNGRKFKNKWASGACIGIYENNKNIRIFGNEFINPPSYTVSYGSEENGIHFK